MLHTCGSAVSKVLAVSRKSSRPDFTYTYNCFESTCLPNFKESLCLQVCPQYVFTWPIKSPWLRRHWQRWGQESSTHLSSPHRALTGGGTRASHLCFWETQAQGDMTDGLPCRLGGNSTGLRLVDSSVCFLKRWNQLGGTAVWFIFKTLLK